MRLRQMPARRAAAAFAIAGLVLAACGDDDDSAATTPEGTESAATAAGPTGDTDGAAGTAGTDGTTAGAATEATSADTEATQATSAATAATTGASGEGTSAGTEATTGASAATAATTRASAEATSAGGAGSAEGASIAAVIKGLDNPFFQAMEDGIEAQAADSGVEVTIQAATSITDTTGQADRLAALAQQDFDCFVVNPISGSNLVQALAPVADADVPIVNIDSPVDADAAEAAGVDIATYIGTDNESAGALAGEHMLELTGGSGEVALIGGIAGDVTSQARLDGFTGAVDGQLDIIQTVAADWERQKALTAATDIMRANPDLTGFFAANDDMGLGIARAVADAGKTGEIIVISVDGNQDALAAVSAGELTATVAQYPYAIGQLGVQACAALVGGATVPESVESPVALVTEENAQQAIDAFPAPFEEFENPLGS